MFESLVLTKCVREQWDSYWRNRPTEIPFSINSVIDDFEELKPGDYEFEVDNTKTVKVFGCKDVPSVAFVGVRQHDEYVLVSMRNRQPHQCPFPKKVKGKFKPKAPEKSGVELPESLKDLTVPENATPKEIMLWAKGKNSDINVFIARHGGSVETMELAGQVGKIVTAATSKQLAEEKAQNESRRSDREKGRDLEYGKIVNLICQHYNGLPDGDGKSEIDRLYRRVQDREHHRL